ncbi:ATP-binding protein [Candidatus Kuenenbacteria bacterium]|nr:ATP-binding protein [Candidatus Kuenenbacteria bacterium]
MIKRKIIDYLNNWKEKKGRKPLILRGARQVGKTSAVLFFAKENFENLIHINLEKPEHLKLFKEDISLEEFEKILQIKFHKKIIPGKTLLFIDEIQNSPALIKLLRFFYEEKPEVHVIGAGSLFEAKLEKEGFSLPVGRIEFAWLYPLDFFEYLEARGEKEILEYLKKISLKEKIPQALHQSCLELFYEYAILGGMPEIVKRFVQKKDFEELKNIYSSLFTSYLEDIYKYSSSAKTKYISYIIEQAPLFAGSTITYEKFGGSNFRSREMIEAFNLLEKTMLLYQTKGTKSLSLPLIQQRKKAPKLIFLDVGLINYQMGIQEKFLNLKDLNEFYQGRIAEQIVGQSLISNFINSPSKIFYWYKDKPQSTAEVDFCLVHQGEILGIEVKSGKAGRLKSLFEFVKTTNAKKAIRIYGGELSKEQIKINDIKFNLISLPFYLLPRVLEIVKD